MKTGRYHALSSIYDESSEEGKAIYTNVYYEYQICKRVHLNVDARQKVFSVIISLRKMFFNNYSL